MRAFITFGSNSFKKQIAFILVVLFILQISLLPSPVQAVDNGVIDPSASYFSSMLYDTGRLASLNLDPAVKEELQQTEASLFSTKNTICLILMYHNFYTSGPRKGDYYARVDNFEKQLQILKSLSFQPITITDLYYFLKFNKKIPQRSVILTFDDGFKSFNLVYPIIKKYKFNCVLSLIAGYIGSPWALSVSDLLKFKKEGLVEFASHTYKLHNNFEKAVKEKQYSLIKTDLIKSKLFFKNELNYNVTAFTYPWGYGSSDKELRSILQKEGFTIGFDTWRRPVNVTGDNPLLVARLDISEIHKNDTPQAFKNTIEKYILNHT